MNEKEVSKVINGVKEGVLKEALNQGFVIFFYTKSDGTKRKAIGTRNVEIIQAISSWRPTGQKENTSVLCYFDLAKLAWRSMKYGSLIDIAITEFCLDWVNPKRYLVSQSFAAKKAIDEAIANGEAGNVPHLVNILTNNFVWQPSDEFVLRTRYVSQKKALQEKVAENYDLKHKYNELVDRYNKMVDRHNEIQAENAKNITILENISKLVNDETVKLYPKTFWRPEKLDE